MASADIFPEDATVHRVLFKIRDRLLPQTVITYIDPISQPPTRNDVVQETMVRSLKVAGETKQSYAVISYDLAVALKAYSIQALQAPAFDKLIILLGIFAWNWPTLELWEHS